jgi:hypothetical protein
MNQMMVQWGERAREYNTLAGATEGIVKKSKDLRLQVEDAQKHCLVQSNKLNESQERLRQAHELLDESNRTSLAKDDILNRLDQAAFSIAASSAIFEHAAENFIPPSTVIRFGDGRETVFQDGNQQREKMEAGLQFVKTVLHAAADDILLLGSPLTDTRRTPFAFPKEVMDVAKSLPGGLTIENIKTSYQQHTDRVTLDAPHTQGDTVPDIPRFQAPVLMQTGEGEAASTTSSARPVEQKGSSKSKQRAKREIKTEDDAATRSTDKARDLHRRRSKPNTTVILQGSNKQINSTKKQSTAHLWNDYGHVVPLQADTNMSKHQGESAYKCSTLHGSGWDVYGSVKQDKSVCWCPECNKKMTETVPFWLPAGRFVYQLRLRWGVDEAGNVLNPDGIAIDPGYNNITEYAEESQGLNDGWTKGNRWFKVPVQHDAFKQPAIPSKPVKADSMPVCLPGTRKVKNSNIFKGLKNDWAELAKFHTRRFESKAPTFVGKFGGPGLVNITLQTLIPAVTKKLAERDSKAFDVTRDWFLAQDLEHWGDQKCNLDAFFRDIGLVIRRPRKPTTKKEKPLVKQEEEGDFAGKKRKRSNVEEDDDDEDEDEDDEGEDESADTGKGRVSGVPSSFGDEMEDSD